MTGHEQTILKLYTILDKKVQRFLPPFFASSDDEAKRMISQEVNYKPSLMCSYPEDYELYFIGTFDQYNGYLDRDEQVMFLICNCKDLKSDDSIKYDELLKEVKKQQGQVDVSVMRFQSAMKDFENSFNALLKNCETKYDSDNNERLSKLDARIKDVELYIPKQNSKKSFLDKLFS